jgi:hypothetical protein
MFTMGNERPNGKSLADVLRTGTDHFRRLFGRSRGGLLGGAGRAVLAL